MPKPRAFIQRYGMPHTRIEFPRLTEQSISREGEGTFLQFAGRDFPVGARPKRKPAKAWEIEIPLARSEQYLANEIDWLLEQAYFADDARLWFVPDKDVNDPVHPGTVVEVHDWDMSREPGGIVRFRFTAQETE